MAALSAAARHRLLQDVDVVTQRDVLRWDSFLDEDSISELRSRALNVRPKVVSIASGAPKWLKQNWDGVVFRWMAALLPGEEPGFGGYVTYAQWFRILEHALAEGVGVEPASHLYEERVLNVGRRAAGLYLDTLARIDHAAEHRLSCDKVVVPCVQPASIPKGMPANAALLRRYNSLNRDLFFLLRSLGRGEGRPSVVQMSHGASELPPKVLDDWHQDWGIATPIAQTLDQLLDELERGGDQTAPEWSDTAGVRQAVVLSVISDGIKRAASAGEAYIDTGTMSSKGLARQMLLHEAGVDGGLMRTDDVRRQLLIAGDRLRARRIATVEAPLRTPVVEFDQCLRYVTVDTSNLVDSLNEWLREQPDDSTTDELQETSPVVFVKTRQFARRVEGIVADAREGTTTVVRTGPKAKAEVGPRGRAAAPESSVLITALEEHPLVYLGRAQRGDRFLVNPDADLSDVVLGPPSPRSLKLAAEDNLRARRAAYAADPVPERDRQKKAYERNPEPKRARQRQRWKRDYEVDPSAERERQKKAYAKNRDTRVKRQQARRDAERDRKRQARAARVVANLTDASGAQVTPDERLGLLSEREAEILCLLVAGLSRRQVADELSMTTSHVSNATTRLLRKLCAASVEELKDRLVR